MTSRYNQVKQALLAHPRRWLISGVAGFIGSNLLEELLRLNQIVIGMDNFSTGFQKNIEEVLRTLPEKQQQNFSFYEGDICSIADCKKATANVDYILHQAALGSVPRSIETPELTNATNVNGFVTLLLAAKEAKIKRFVYASSSSVYGDSPELPKKEEHQGNLLSPYAVSKYTNELYAHVFGLCYGMQTIGLRYFNVFGPRQDPLGPYAAVIPSWIAALQENKPVYINGDGETSRDFCYVSNAVQANILAATTDNQAAMNTVYNVAVGEQNTLKKLYDLLVILLDVPKDHQLIYRDFRSGDIRHSLADIEKAKRLLEYAPTETLFDGLQKMITISKE